MIITSLLVTLVKDDMRRLNKCEFKHPTEWCENDKTSYNDCEFGMNIWLELIKKVLLGLNAGGEVSQIKQILELRE